MAVTSSGVTGTTLRPTNFPAVLDKVNLTAKKLSYESALLRHLCRPLTGKGSMLHFPYFDPTTFATAASVVGTETHDFSTTTQLVNSSVIITASNFRLRADLTDRAKRGAVVDLPGEIGRQIGIGLAHALDHHVLGALSGFNTGTVTGTLSTLGFAYGHYGAAQAKLAARALTVPRRYAAVIPEYGWYYTARSTYSQTYAAALPDLGDSVLQKWYRQTIMGNIDIYPVGLSLIAASSSAYGYLFAQDGVGLWVEKDASVETERNASNELTEYVGTMWAGAKVLISGFGLPVRMLASAPTGA